VDKHFFLTRVDKHFKVPSCCQLTQEVNKKFHKPLAIEDTGIIN